VEQRFPSVPGQGQPPPKGMGINGGRNLFTVENEGPWTTIMSGDV